MSDVLGYLAEKGLYPKGQAYGESRFSCFFHEEEPGKRGRLYVNTDVSSEPGGLFHCKVCDARGNLITLKKHFGDPIGDSDNSSNRRYEVMQAANRYFEDCLDLQEEVQTYLANRGLTMATVAERRLGWADGTLLGHMKSKGFSLLELREVGLVGDNGEFFSEHITIPYLVNSNVVTIRGKEIGGKYLSLSHSKVRLYNTDVCFTDDIIEVAICEGEFDSMLSQQMGVPAVALPGAMSWQAAWTGYFEKMKRVYVIFDNDDPGRAGAEKVQKSLGSKARVVDLGPRDAEQASNNDGNDITDWVKLGHGDEDFLKLLRHTAGGLLITVAEAYEEWEQIEDLSGIKLGYPLLDANLGKGMLPGQVAVVLAKSGEGKTMWVLNTFDRILRVPGQEGKKILFVSLEQTRSEWFERALKIARFHDPWLDPPQVRDFWSDKLMIVDKNRVGEQELLNSIEDFEYHMGQKPDFIAIDYLGYWARSYKGERYQQTSDAVMALKAIAKEERLTILTPHQVNRGVAYGEEPSADAARDAGVVEETADFLFTVWNPDSAKGTDFQDRKNKLMMRIAKSRHGGKGRHANFIFCAHSLAIVQDSDPLQGASPEMLKTHDEEIARAKADNWYYSTSKTYEHALEQHRKGDEEWVNGHGQ